jgi:hypothetical protein
LRGISVFAPASVIYEYILREEAEMPLFSGRGAWISVSKAKLARACPET